MNISKPKLIAILAFAATVSATLVYKSCGGPPAPCEIVTDRALRPGMVIECPTGERVNCDTTFYYRLP